MLQAAADHGWVLNWAGVAAILTGVAGALVKWIIPAVRGLRSDPPAAVVIEDRGRGSGSYQNGTAMLAADVARLESTLQAEIVRATEWRVEMKTTLAGRTPLFLELTSQTRKLADELSRLADANERIAQQVTVLEERSRGQDEAIRSVLVKQQRGKR